LKTPTTCSRVHGVVKADGDLVSLLTKGRTRKIADRSGVHARLALAVGSPCAVTEE
jgi:hypothetical protein